MKTNVNMVRMLGNIEVVQRTKDGMFNATYFLKQYTEQFSKNSKKEIASFLKKKSTKEFITALLSEGYGHMAKSPHDGTCLKSVVYKSRANKGNNAGTWMTPLLFIDFAMWVNPTFKVQVLKFVYDQLIKTRHLAGDNYRKLSEAASAFKNVDYKKIAKAINWIVFNKHESGIRQIANEAELAEINELENKMCFAIEMGYITTFEALIHELRKMYYKKYAVKF